MMMGRALFSILIPTRAQLRQRAQSIRFRPHGMPSPTLERWDEHAQVWRGVPPPPPPRGGGAFVKKKKKKTKTRRAGGPSLAASPLFFAARRGGGGPRPHS